jgi:hypothetical protein
MRRSFRTHRLCALPGVSPRAGMRCPVGALRTPHQHRAFPRSPHRAPGPRVRRQRNLTRTQTRTKKPTRESPKSGPNTKSAPSGSGNGPERALEANTKAPRAQRESPYSPELPQRAQARSRGALTVHPAPAPAPALGHRKTGASPRVHAAFLQNAPVVCPTRGFTPGWYRGRDGRCRPPLPPNRTGGFPASGSPVGESPA